MGKQTFVRIKRGLTILLAVLFLISITSLAVNAQKANFDPSWGPRSQAAYNAEYRTEYSRGAPVGTVDGNKDGTNDCRSGQDDTGGDSTKYYTSTTDTSAKALGGVDGYNDGIDSTYSTAYENGYQTCQNKGEQNSKIVSMPNTPITAFTPEST